MSDPSRPVVSHYINKDAEIERWRARAEKAEAVVDAVCDDLGEEYIDALMENYRLKDNDE